jgi:N-acetyl-beta-hexosaminidase
MQAKGVSTTPALYHTFVADLDELVKRHGRTLIVWNDAIKPGVAPMPPKDIVIDAWTNDRDVKALAEAGYTLVNSSNRPLYLSSYGQRQGFPLSAVWQWTPRRFGLRAGNAGDADLKAMPLPDGASVLGGQACAWATEQGLMERRLYPRLLAVAETLWTGEARGDYGDFMRRLGAGQRARLHQLGVPDNDAVPAEKIFAPDNGELRVVASSGDTRVTAKKYRDFVLTFERRADQNTGSTGFCVRCASDSSTGSTPGFPVLSTPPAGMKIVAQDVRELRGWNQFELTARGQIVSLTVNGYLAWSVTDPSPQPGFIVLKSDTSDFEVRNVTVRSLDR